MAASVLSAPWFHDEAAAYTKLESIVWPQGPHCPRCGGFDRITKVKGGRLGLWRCGPCKRQFRVTVGTVFESAHVPLDLWFQAMHLLCTSKKGFSSHQLYRTIGVTYKTAWFMTHRIREAMAPHSHLMAALGGGGKIVEADETFVGGKERNKHAWKRNAANVGGAGKEPVFSLVERGGEVRSQHVLAVDARTLRPVLQAQLDKASWLMTDGEGQYRILGPMFARHEVVNHGIGEYVRGEAHTNTVEGYFSILKRGIIGTYHHVSQQHLKRYLAEFDFRYNQRVALGVGDVERTETAFRGIVGKRLTYRGTDHEAATDPIA